MKIRALAVAAGLLAAHSAANAWFFFWIPTGQIASAIQGDHCVSPSDKPGDTLHRSGRAWLIKSTSGVSSRCNMYPQWPVIAKLEPVLTESELRTEHSVCVQQGVTVGSRTTIPDVGEVEVLSIGGQDCSDVRAPLSAKVVRVQSAAAQAASAEASKVANRPKDIFSKPAEKSVADRLRELKQLRDENLITQEVYEAKQKDILAGQ